MFKRFRYMILLVILLISVLNAGAQMAMPDYVHVGSTKHYNVTPHPGSTYSWWIDGVEQAGVTTHEIDITWTTTTPNPHVLVVKELSPGGCIGLSSGEVFVDELNLSATGHDPLVCSPDGSIDFTFTNVPDGTYTINYDGGSFNNIAVASGKATVTAPVGTYNNLTITIAGATSPSGVTIIITATPDTVLPNFTLPGPFIKCVENLISVRYNPVTKNIDYNQPDYYTFNPGDLLLDLDPASFTDNCNLSCPVEIRWKIDMNDGTRIPALPVSYQTGQPSTYGSTIKFSGDGVTYVSVVQTITYWIVDCAGNVSAPQTQTITIKPRPKIE
jgi:hypothetical protein